MILTKATASATLIEPSPFKSPPSRSVASTIAYTSVITSNTLMSQSALRSPVPPVPSPSQLPHASASDPSQPSAIPPQPNASPQSPLSKLNSQHR